MHHVFTFCDEMASTKIIYGINRWIEDGNIMLSMDNFNF